MKHRSIVFCSLLCLFLSGSGCGYTLVGQGNLPEHIKTIAIPTFENTTLEGGIEEIITQAVIEEFVGGGKVRLVSETEADALLSGTITTYNADEAVTYNEENEVSSYKLVVEVEVELQDLVNETVLWQTSGLNEESDFEGGPGFNITDQEENEHEALQDVAEELAQEIRTLSTEGF